MEENDLFREETNEDKKTSETRDEGYFNKIHNFIYAVLIAVLISFFLKTFIVEAYKIPTSSMEKTLLVGDFLLVNKLIFGPSTPRTIPFTNIQLPFFSLPAIRKPKPSDVVVFEYPGDRDKLKPETSVNYIKRCVAGPGDTIEIKNKIVYLNGKEFFRPPMIQYLTPYIKPSGRREYSIFPKGAEWNEDNYGPLYVPKEGDVMKIDNFNIEKWRTLINREFGEEVVEVDGRIIKIEGRPVKSYTIKKNYYFMLGDNRDDSSDSRFWGFVPEDKIIGEALMIYWSWDTSAPNLIEQLRSVRLSRITMLID